MEDATQDAPAPGAVRVVADPGSLLRLNNLLQLLTNGAWYIGTPFIPLYLVSHGASSAVVGAVAGLSGIAPLAVSLHAGGFVDERGPAIVLVASVALFGLGGFLLTVLNSVPGVAIAYTLMATANIGLAVASQAVVAVASSQATRIRNYGYYAVSYSAGAVAGPVIGGFLVGRFGYVAAFGAMTLLALPSLAIASLLRNVPTSAHRRVAVGVVHTFVGPIVRARGVGAILFVSAIMMCARALQTTFYPLYLSKVGLPATLIGIAIAAVGLASVAVRMLLAWGVAGLGQRGALIGAMTLSAVAFAVTPFIRDFWLLVGVSGLMGASLGFTQPLSMSLLAESVADEFWGIAFGIRQSVQRVGSIISPFAFGVASAARGVESAFYLGALTLFVAVGITAKMSGELGRRPDAPP